MQKLSHLVGEDWVEHSYPPIFCTEVTTGEDRIKVGVPGGDASVFSRLGACITAPFYLLYVLHTPRGEGEEGRYQSPELSASDVADFVDRYAPYLAGDARHDLWVHSPGDSATVVWDRHNLICAYGPLSRFSEALRGLGFTESKVLFPDPHAHHYRSEFDTEAASVLSALDWRHSPLQPEDEQEV